MTARVTDLAPRLTRESAMSPSHPIDSIDLGGREAGSRSLPACRVRCHVKRSIRFHVPTTAARGGRRQAKQERGGRPRPGERGRGRAIKTRDSRPAPAAAFFPPSTGDRVPHTHARRRRKDCIGARARTPHFVSCPISNQSAPPLPPTPLRSRAYRALWPAAYARARDSEPKESKAVRKSANFNC